MYADCSMLVFQFAPNQDLPDPDENQRISRCLCTAGTAGSYTTFFVFCDNSLNVFAQLCKNSNKQDKINVKPTRLAAMMCLQKVILVLSTTLEYWFANGYLLLHKYILHNDLFTMLCIVLPFIHFLVSLTNCFNFTIHCCGLSHRARFIIYFGCSHFKRNGQRTGVIDRA